MFRRFFSQMMWKLKQKLHPANKLTMHQIGGEWRDRDDIMFHAMFQILVDFVELEQPFVAWDKQVGGRFTDRKVMHDYVDYLQSDEYATSLLFDPETQDEQSLEQARESAKREYLFHKELLFLYEWYKDEKYNFCFQSVKAKTGKDFYIGETNVETIDTGEPRLITLKEAYEISDEHNATCDNMLYRILRIREKLWV
jgi:hypothetical protein